MTSESPSVMSDSLQPHGLYPWNSSGQNTGVDSLSLLQGIFPTQESNQGLQHFRQILYQLSYEGSPINGFSISIWWLEMNRDNIWGCSLNKASSIIADWHLRMCVCVCDFCLFVCFNAITKPKRKLNAKKSAIKTILSFYQTEKQRELKIISFQHKEHEDCVS